MKFDCYVDKGVLELKGEKNLKIQKLVEYLQQRKDIVSLSLNDCDISSKDIEILANSNFMNLACLNLANNKIDHEGAKALASGNWGILLRLI